MKELAREEARLAGSSPPAGTKPAQHWGSGVCEIADVPLGRSNSSSCSSARFSQATAFAFDARTRQQPGALLWLPKGRAEIDDVSRYASHRHRYAAVCRKLPRRIIPIQRPQIHARRRSRSWSACGLGRASDHYKPPVNPKQHRMVARTRPRFDVRTNGSVFG